MGDYVGSTTKTPNEVKRYKVDYTDWLDVGEKVIDAQYTVSGAGDLVTVPVHTVDADGLGITFFLASGDDGETYDVVIQITTDGGQTKEDALSVTVANAP